MFLLFTQETEIIKLPSNGKAVGGLALGKNIKVCLVSWKVDVQEENTQETLARRTGVGEVPGLAGHA